MEKCQTCKFYKPNPSSGDPKRPASIGRCRRFPPITGQDTKTLNDVFEMPGVTEDCWCGEWKPIKGN